MAQGDAEPITVYGSKISYYTGKLEGYLRYKEIPYRFVALSPSIGRRLRRETGTSQIPAVELPDGRFMTDTTPMIDWFEAHYPEPSVIPSDPLQAFASRLVEDYAEEWLWRPAMHFRWSYRSDALLLSAKITDELLTEIPLPSFAKRFAMRRRQGGYYVRRDGVDQTTWDHVESIYFDTLNRLSNIFAKRPFLLGKSPTLADFGFFASMFRHFSQDPTPAEIMRSRAPRVFEWQARLWNARASAAGPELLSGIPQDWGTFLTDIGSAYLPYLCSNAESFASGKNRHDVTVEGITYRNLPVSQYRVWCLERLRSHFEVLPKETKLQAQALLERHGAWKPLWQVEDLRSGHDPNNQVPFQGRKVHYDLRRRI
ncbi:MAG: glutathione S-transferase [Deltaproteobacteria bacterium]|nr:glutathione S-transferase [Deltaproteobacteria bacterium]